MINAYAKIRGTGRRLKVSACILSVALLSLAWRSHLETPRAWAAQEVPVAFWAWRNEMPGEAEVERARSEARAQTLFLRAGQFDLAGGKLARIRPADGKFPRALPLHLVYNATRGLLSEFERVDESALASVVAETFRRDLERAAAHGAQEVVGLQLDFDVPTRLLPRYARVLRGVRGGLAPRTQLSITGLPTWMESATLGQTLDAVDFWIPQCYGATIPERIEAATPISSPESVARCVARARKLERPFYAGLSAYGYAILYDEHGALIELRGDLDPARVAHDPNFALVERRPFPAPDAAPGERAGSAVASEHEWRYVYRALEDGLVQNTPVRAGDRMLLDVPSAETLRASARIARTEGGARLLGLCLFRLPGASEPTTLTLPQITAALDDATPGIATDVQLESDAGKDAATHDARRLRIKATNSGVTGALFGDDALTLTLQVPAGSVAGVISLDNISAVESFCGRASARELRPCSLRRADTLRLRTQVWQAGATAGAVLSFTDEHLPDQLPVQLAVRADDGRVWQSSRQISTRRDERR
jgi:hypothetical protein